MTDLRLADLIRHAAQRTPEALAVVDSNADPASQAAQQTTYAELWQQTGQFAQALAMMGVIPGERVAVYLEKRLETVVACFGAAHAGALFVPANPILRAAQVSHILQDCAATVLITSATRLASLAAVLSGCPALRHIVLVDAPPASPLPAPHPVLHSWPALLKAAALPPRAVPAEPTFSTPPLGQATNTHPAAIFYTSGSTGRPKGVVISHRNFILGAHSVAQYLENRADDRLLAALPLSFDAGFSQLTTAFSVGAAAVLHNYLLPRDLLRALHSERITGLTAVPPLYIQLARGDWPAGCADTLRYFATTGGRMPGGTLARLRQKMRHAKPFLMYGLTEAFRSTYLPPDEVGRRPDSIGRAIPHAEVLVLRSDGTLCDADEPGELVHRGPLVTLGYWNNPAATQERFKPVPPRFHPAPDELAVYSGDTVRRDAEGFLYFVGRRDEMIKTSGYRVSPTEIEEVLYTQPLVAECAAFGLPHETLGEAIHVVVALNTNLNETTGDARAELLAACRQHLPPYMAPTTLTIQTTALPRNANGKIDRATLRAQLACALTACAEKPAAS
jgi:acyl-CoA ligase (AMP-forming) (exosortase A-associated)